MRTGKNDKDLISDECFKAYQHIAAARALVAFALYQAENADAAEFMKLQSEWSAMLRLMREKLDLAQENNGEASYIAETEVINEGAVH